MLGPRLHQPAEVLWPGLLRPDPVSQPPLLHPLVVSARGPRLLALPRRPSLLLRPQPLRAVQLQISLPLRTARRYPLPARCV